MNLSTYLYHFEMSIINIQLYISSLATLNHSSLTGHPENFRSKLRFVYSSSQHCILLILPLNGSTDPFKYVCVREREYTGEVALPGYQICLLHLSWNGRVDWAIVLMQENKTNSDILTFRYKWKGKERQNDGWRYTEEESHRCNLRIVTSPSRQKANIQRTSEWIIYKVVKPEETKK